MAPATLFSATSPPLPAPKLPPCSSSRRIYFARPLFSKPGSYQLGAVCSSESRRAAVRCNGATRFIKQSEFPAEVLQSELPVLVDFVADWCGPCRLIAPAIDWASQEFEGRLKVVKIDHDSNPELIEEYKIYGLPTLIIFKDGEEVPNSRQEGALTKPKLKAYLDSMLDQITPS